MIGKKPNKKFTIDNYSDYTNIKALVLDFSLVKFNKSILHKSMALPFATDKYSCMYLQSKICNTVANRLCAHRYPQKIDYPLLYFPPKISTQYRICITDVSGIRCIHYPRYFAFPHRQRIVDSLPYLNATKLCDNKVL